MCMFNAPKEVKAFSGELQYVDTCPNSPLIGMTFYQEHYEVMKTRDLPIKLHNFNEDFQIFATRALSAKRKT